MDINQKLRTHLHQAMKENDITSKRVLRLLMTSIKLAEVAKSSELDDIEVLGIIQKETKTKQDAIADAKKAERNDLIAEAEDDIKILEKYLPEQIPQEELHALGKELIEELGATSMKDTGKVIKAFIAKLAGRASNQEASKVIRDILQDKLSKQ
ncbi:MAG: GatB/YqeY domain-containing protein [Chloroflexota bacterium]